MSVNRTRRWKKERNRQNFMTGSSLRVAPVKTKCLRKWNYREKFTRGHMDSRFGLKSVGCWWDQKCSVNRIFRLLLGKEKRKLICELFRLLFAIFLISLSLLTLVLGGMDPRCKICIFMGKTDPNADKHEQQVNKQANSEFWFSWFSEAIFRWTSIMNYCSERMAAMFFSGKKCWNGSVLQAQKM